MFTPVLNKNKDISTRIIETILPVAIVSALAMPPIFAEPFSFGLPFGVLMMALSILKISGKTEMF